MKKRKIELNRKLVLQKEKMGSLSAAQSNQVAGGSNGCAPTYDCVVSNGDSLLPQYPCCRIVSDMPSCYQVNC